MTSVLTEIRRLEDALARGEIDAAAFAKLRGEVLDLIEEAEVATAPPKPAVNDAAVILRQAIWVALGLCALTLVVGWVARDWTLALTLSVTLLAGIIIRLARPPRAPEDALETDEDTVEP